MDGRVPLKIDTHWTSIVNTDLLKIEVEGRAKEPSERALSSEQWLPQILKDENQRHRYRDVLFFSSDPAFKCLNI